MRGLEELKFQKIYENIATGIALTNLDGFFEECNAAYSALTGYSPDELRKLQFFSLIHSEDLDEIKRRIKALLEGREPQFEIEGSYVAKSGAIVWVRNFVSTIPDAERRPLGSSRSLPTSQAGSARGVPRQSTGNRIGCGTKRVGVFADKPGNLGPRRLPVMIERYAA